MPGGRRWVQVEAIEMPKLSVIRLEYSTETSSWRVGGSSPVLNPDTVGNDSSSATQGSSVPSVAGKKRPPTKQCANAPLADMMTPSAMGTAASIKDLRMDMTPLGWQRSRSGTGPTPASRAHSAVKRNAAARARRKANENDARPERDWPRP